MIGCIIGKMDMQRKGRNRGSVSHLGYVAMIVVKKEFRRQKIA